MPGADAAARTCFNRSSHLISEIRLRIGDGYTGPEMTSPTAWVAAAVVLALGLTVTAVAVIWQQRQASAEVRGL